ncbi:MAG TPA: hypothetical protein VGN72_04610 [Tepidisphaeraceae bacterium]|jgi:protein-tyrosine-phosphatase|nr:hypothetical protein [Tepidisphaeraceae bacterium]
MSWPTILFLCTGNYYRSRFAEHLFNYIARERGLLFRAESRGLAIELAAGLPGNISGDTVRRLIELGVVCDAEHRCGIACTADDLSRAHLVIALKEGEHRPLLVARHPGWENRVTYWHVHDLDAAKPDEALADIERLVQQLADELLIAARKQGNEIE